MENEYYDRVKDLEVGKRYKFPKVSGRTMTGLMLLISAKTGMGSGRLKASSIKALPPFLDPVKPTALIERFKTKFFPTVLPSPKSMEKAPSGQLHFLRESRTFRPTNKAVPGCAWWAFTMTGQPAAQAEAESPPATEKARGKLLAQNTATGPIGRSIERISGFGMGWRSDCARSTLASTQWPFSTKSANILS